MLSSVSRTIALQRPCLADLAVTDPVLTTRPFPVVTNDTELPMNYVHVKTMMIPTKGTKQRYISTFQHGKGTSLFSRTHASLQSRVLPANA